MEFEKALFRVYERVVPHFAPSPHEVTPSTTLVNAENGTTPVPGPPFLPQESTSGLGNGGSEGDLEQGIRGRAAEGSTGSSVCKKWSDIGNEAFWTGVERALLVALAFLLLCLVTLHSSFVGNGTCLKESLFEQHGMTADIIEREAREEALSTNSSQEFDISRLTSDAILHIKPFQSSTSEGKISFQDGYEFSCSVTSVRIREPLRSVYGIPSFNVTLPESCLGGSWLWKASIRNLFGIDTIMVNQAMYAFHCDGFLRNKVSEEIWSWDRESFSNYEDYTWLRFFTRRVRVVLKSIMSFAIFSAIVGMIVRILISSGVAIMFPLFNTLRSFGVDGIRSRILSLSYPWIGAQLELLDVQGQSSGPLIMAHVAFMLVFYFMYDAVQILSTLWLYNKSIPDGLMQHHFGLIMMCEYFSLLFARSRLTIMFFPKAVMMYYVIFHCYFSLTFYGFSSLALLCAFICCLHLEIYCLRKHEVRCLQRNLVSHDQPRTLYSELPHPQWNRLLPPLYSMFYPLNRQVRSVYEDEDRVEDSAGNAGNDIVPGRHLQVAISSDGNMDLNVVEASDTPNQRAENLRQVSAPMAPEMPGRLSVSHVTPEFQLVDSLENRSSAARAAEARRRGNFHHGPSLQSRDTLPRNNHDHTA